MPIDPLDWNINDLRAGVKMSSEMVENWKNLGSKAYEVKDILTSALKEGHEQGQEMYLVTDSITGQLKAIGENASIFTKELGTSVKTSAELSANLLLINTSFEKAVATASNWNKIIAQSERGMKDFGGTGATALWNLGEGLINIGSGITKGGLGVGQILEGLIQVGKVLDSMDKYWAAMNRAVYDTNAALGKMGEYSSSLVSLASDLGLKYVKNIQEVEKLINSVATIGVSEEHIAVVTDNILDLTTRWSAMTPEKQIQLMSTYMKEFGMDGVSAHNVIKGLYLTASKLKESVKELDAGQFIEQVTQVATNTRRMNFEFADAQKYVAVIVGQLGTTPDVLKRAAEFAQAMMQYGQQSLGMQVFMMERMGVTGNVFEQLGTWTTDPELRVKAQITMFKERIEDVGRKPIKEMGEKELAGVIKVAGFGGIIPGMDEVLIAEIVKKDGAGLEKLLGDMEKAERSRADAQKSMPGNIEELVRRTTANSDHFKLWTETQFFRKEGVSGYVQRRAQEAAEEGKTLSEQELTFLEKAGFGKQVEAYRKMAKQMTETGMAPGLTPEIAHAFIVKGQKELKALPLEREKEIEKAWEKFDISGMSTEDAAKKWEKTEAEITEQYEKDIKTKKGKLAVTVKWLSEEEDSGEPAILETH